MVAEKFSRCHDKIKLILILIINKTNIKAKKLKFVLKEALSFYLLFLVMNNSLQKICSVSINLSMYTIYVNVLELPFRYLLPC